MRHVCCDFSGPGRVEDMFSEESDLNHELTEGFSCEAPLGDLVPVCSESSIVFFCSRKEKCSGNRACCAWLTEVADSSSCHSDVIGSCRNVVRSGRRCGSRSCADQAES